MARFDTSTKVKLSIEKRFPRGGLIGLGIGLILISLIILGLSVYEGFFNSGSIRLVQAPGFHELDLKTPGLYAGVYQHRGDKPMPVEALSKLDVRVMSKSDYEDIAVIMNSGGNTFRQFGVQGMPLFQFVVDRPGAYTLSAVYTEGTEGPTVPIYIIPQSAQNIKQTLVVGVMFCVLFLGLGLFLLVKLNSWAPPEGKSVLKKK